jgi:uncharacterized protein YjbI with pentapeptide repeats
MTGKPHIKLDPLYQLLREGKIDEFNRRKGVGEKCDLRGCDFRALDLRGLDASGLDFSDAYFHQADLRGLDLRQCRLEGASLNMTKISGVYFPAELTADEIHLSVNYGTRLRYQR